MTKKIAIMNNIIVLKMLRIFFWISYSLCLIELILFVLAFFGGAEAILEAIEARIPEGRGLVYISSEYSTLPKVLSFLTMATPVLYFTSLLLCLTLPLFKCMRNKLRYIVGISCQVIIVFLAILPLLLFSILT